MQAFSRFPRPRAVATAAALLLALVSGSLAACDSGEGSSLAEQSAETGEVETTDPLPELPSGWGEEVNRSAGFAVGVPPGWEVRGTEEGQGTVLSSPDDLLTVSVTADRTRGALELPLDDFAVRTARALGSEVLGADRFRDLTVGRPAPFDHAYDAVGVRAQGVSGATGVVEKVLVVAIRREDVATFIAVVRENRDKSSEFGDRETIKRLLRSVRGRPPA